MEQYHAFRRQQFQRRRDDEITLQSIKTRINQDSLLKAKLTGLDFLLVSPEANLTLCYFGIGNTRSEIFIIETNKETPDKLIVISRFKKYFTNKKTLMLRNTWHQEASEEDWIETKRPLGKNSMWTGARKKLTEEANGS